MCKILIDKVVIVLLLLFSILPAPAQETGPVAWWSFDESSGETVFDGASQIVDSLRGNYKYVGGVIGNSLRFDGYTTHVVREVDHVPTFEGSFTIEAWIAPQTNPWNWRRQKSSRARRWRNSVVLRAPCRCGRALRRQ